MNKTYFVALTLFILALQLNAQKVFTKEAKVSFFSKAPLETIEAQNNSGVSVINLADGQIEFSVLIKAFQFEKALMQEHFNENYLESGKFPKAVFKGQLSGAPINSTKDGATTAKAKGQLTIHGVTKDIIADVTLNVKGGALSGTTTFTIAVADYNIAIPGLVKDKIAKNVDVTVKANYQPLPNN